MPTSHGCREPNQLQFRFFGGDQEPYVEGDPAKVNVAMHHLLAPSQERVRFVDRKRPARCQLISRAQVLYTYTPKIGEALIFNSNITHDGTELLSV